MHEWCFNNKIRNILTTNINPSVVPAHQRTNVRGVDPNRLASPGETHGIPTNPATEVHYWAITKSPGLVVGNLRTGRLFHALPITKQTRGSWELLAGSPPGHRQLQSCRNRLIGVCLAKSVDVCWPRIRTHSLDRCTERSGLLGQ